MAAGLQLIGVQPNSGELLKLEGGDVRNVAPRELTFQFSEGQTIDTNTLAAAIHVTRRGGDEAFQVATATTDFNTAGRVVVQFQSLEAGDLGNQISLWFTKSNRGVAAAPKITVNGKQIIAELNTYASSPTTATALVSAITNDPYAKLLVQASIVSGVRTTDIATPSIIYSPLNLTGANAATRSTNFNLPTSVNLQVTFTAVQPGVAGNGISIEFSKLNRGGAGSPLIQVVNNQRILVQLNSNPGNETTASQLVSAFNANAAARALVVAANPFGNPNQNITTPTINYSPLVLSGANDIAVTPGYLGLGDSAREVIFRFAETLPDGVYEVDISGVGLTALRNTQKQALGDTTPDGIVDDGQDFRMQFTLDLGPQIVGVVPQPVSRTAAGVLTQAENQIEVYFDKALDPTTAAKTDFYQLIFTSDTVTTTDDRVYKPATAAYFAASNRVLLTFAAPLQQLGVGSFRLRIGTDEQPLAPPTALNLTNTEVGDSFQKSYNLGSLTGSQIVSSAISPQVYQLTFPGASDEPGQRQSQISSDVESHLLDAADSVNGISTLSYNFRNIYGVDPAGNQLSNLITADQKQRTREIFDLYGEKLGVKFVETQSQGFTIVTGDMRAINPTVLVAPNGPVAYSSPLFRIAVMDSSKNWNDAFGPSDDTARISWFETAMSQIGTLLGLGYTDELPPGTIMGSEPALTFDNPVEPVYPGDNDIVHGQYLYRPEGQDIDLYKFQLTERGSLSAETLAERQTDSSLLNTVLRLYQEDSNGQRVLIAQNDDYFSNDSFLHLTLDKGTYYVGVSAAGNDSYDPTIAESGMGGLSEGKYDLRLTFRRDVTTSILGYEKPENASRVAPFLDGDGNGVPGGVYNFWFRATSQQLFVDKAVTSGANGTLGTLGRPYDKIKDALLAAQLQPGSVVRIVGNAGPDGNPATPADALPYQIGFDSQLGLPLPDGSTLDVPKNITVMIDPGVVIKLRRARIDVGSSTVAIDQSGGALQVLGTPRMVDSAGNVRRDSNGNVLPGSVYFTALTDETLGGDTTPNGTTTGQPGDWGGLVFRNDVDRAVKGVDGTLLRPEPEQQGIFLNYVNQADLRYGGGTVIVNGTPQAITPIWTAAARPTVTFNTITRSADAAISANPDSFEESNFNAPQYQAAYAIRQTMTLGGTPSGTVTLSYNNVSGTVATTLTYTPGLSPTAAQVRTHLNSIPELQNNVSVVGSNGGPFTVVFGNALANAAVSLLKQTTTGGATAEIVNSTLFTADYARLGPDIHGNRLLQNSINGVFIRVQTPAGSQLQKMTVAGRWAATDAVYVVAENLEIAGSPGGPTQLLTAPEVSLVTLQTQPVGNTEVQQLTFGDDSRGAPLGNFTLTFGTNLSTAPIPYTSIPTDLARLIQTELDNVLGAGSTRVSVVDSATYSVEFTEGLANANFPLLVASDPDLGGTLTVSAVRDGVGNSVQTMVLGGAPGGKVRLSYNSVPGTAVTTLTYTPGLSPTATDVLAHLNSIPQLNNNVSVVGRAGGPFTVVFRNALANATVLPLGQMTTDGATAVISVNPPGTGGSVPAGMTNYKLTYVSAPNPDGTVTESPASVATADITVVVTNPLTGQTQRVQLSNLPVAPLPYVGRRLYRTTKASDGTTAPDYILIANLNATDGTYVDDGTTLGGLLQNSVGQLTARLHGSLVIDPGVVVKLSGAGIQTRFGSQLIAEGQPGAEVVFTSLQDSRYGAGGTFATSAVTGTASAGSWSGLYLGPDSRASLDYAVLAFGGGISKVPGGFAGFNTIEVQQAQARITNSLFEQNANGTGGSSGPNRAGYSSNAAATIFVRGAQPVIVDNTFLTNRGPVINVNANALSASVVSDSGRSTGLLGRLDNYVDNRGPLVRDNQLDGNGINGMQVRGATLTTESVWDDTDIVHVVQNETIYVPDFHTYGGLRLQSAADQSLVVKLTGAKAGFTATGRPLDITDRIGGVVQVVGQPDQPVVLTALADDTVGAGFRPNGMPQVDTDNLALGNTANPGPQSGAWRSIRLEQNSHDRNVDTVVEAETGVPSATDINAMPDHAQYLGALAPDEKSGDDNLRLGFTVQGSIRQPSDVDTFSFTAQAGTQVWLDIDRTTFALDTVLELVAADGTTVLAGSDNSGAEAVDPSLLVRYPDPEVLPHNHVNPLAESPFDVPDRWTINPKDAGLRVVLPGSSGDTNTYFVRVRSSGGLTAGVYQLQVRLRELDEIGGSAIHGADIRYATTGIDLVGLPVHSPLLGEASEPLTNGADTNNSQAAATNLGNLLNTDRGTLGVAGNIATAGDVDWYSFTVQYDSIRAAPSPTAPQFLAMVFDIDYADGYARANTNLWVYDVNGNLVLSSRDSNVSDDRPTGTSAATTDLSRGSVGTLDPYIGTVEVPDKGVNQDVYYVAVSSNARIPTEMQQYLTRLPANPLLRLEPVNSVQRIAEDHVGSPGYYTTFQGPTLPILLGADNLVTLIAPAGSQLRDGETFTITNGLGNSQTYEFDLDGQANHIPVVYSLSATAAEIGTAISAAITADPPASPLFPSQPTASTPSVTSTLQVSGSSLVTVAETILRETLLYTLSSGLPQTRFTTHSTTPTVRQNPAPGEATTALTVSRPAAIPYNLNDVTLFVNQQGQTVNQQGQMGSSELVSVDPFSGQQETRVGQNQHVGDIALRPDGSLFGFSIPQNVPQQNDANTGNYIQIVPGSLTPANLGTNQGDDGILTYNQDPKDPTKAVLSNDPANGVGVNFGALTFTNSEVSTAVQGFAIGSRADASSPPRGVPNPSNLLFEFNPSTGAAINPPGYQDRADAGLLQAGGTQIVERGALNTSVDAYPATGGNPTLTGVKATNLSTQGVATYVIEDGDYFQVDSNGDGVADRRFEFDTGPEFYFDANWTRTPANPDVLRDGDSFTVDGLRYEFDTGSVLVVTAGNGAAVGDGGMFTLTDNDPQNPITLTFELDRDTPANVRGGSIAIPITVNMNPGAIINSIISTINSQPFALRAVLLPGTNRITLLNESATSAAVAVGLQGVALQGAAGFRPGSIRIPVEEYTPGAIGATNAQIGSAIMQVINGATGVTAGAAGTRLNFMGATAVDFAGVSHPVFGVLDVATGLPTGTPGITSGSVPVPFLASDTAVDVATHVQAALTVGGLVSTQAGATVFLDPTPPQATFVTVSLGTPPLIGLRGTPDCPLSSGGVAPGGTITGMAFVGDQLFSVTDTGGLFRIASYGGGAFSTTSAFNVADYVDNSQQLLSKANEVTTTTYNPITGLPIVTSTYQPIRFAGLTAGHRNTEDGRYENLLFGIDVTGRVFAFDTFGQTQAVFANGALSVDTGLGGVGVVQGLAFANLDDTLWHQTTNRSADAGHGVDASFDMSRVAESDVGNTSYYFGYENSQVASQAKFGTYNYSPSATGATTNSTYANTTATRANSYDFAGGAHGSLIGNAFSLQGYSAGDRPTLYFNYFLETEQAPTTSDATLQSNPRQYMRDALQVYISGEDGSWKLLATNNSDIAPNDSNDEHDSFVRVNPLTGLATAEQPFARQDAFDATANWRQARIDLSPYVGQTDLRLRFDFSTAGGLSTGGRLGNTALDLNVAGNELRAIPAAQLQDGDTFTVTDPLTGTVTKAFEFDLGPTIVTPSGAAITDGSTFTIWSNAVDSTIYEFDNNGTVGSTNTLPPIPHIAVPFTGAETPAQLAANINAILLLYPPTSAPLTANLTTSEPNDTRQSAVDTGLDGSTQLFRATGLIGDNPDLTGSTSNLDVDMLQLQLEVGDRVTIKTDTSGFGSTLDSYLRLFDSRGQQQDFNNNAVADSATGDSEIDYTATERGLYYVGVSAAHNPNYSPLVAGSGIALPGSTVTSGGYAISILVATPYGPERIGNRLNLPDAHAVMPTGLPASFVEGAGGVRSVLPNTTVPVYAIPLRLSMPDLAVADAIHKVLAEQLAGGNLDGIKQRDEVVNLVEYGIGSAGKLGISGPSDPNTALAHSGLFGDRFSAFAASADRYGTTPSGFPGAQSMQRNKYEGVYIDDIVIGFAGRGEMATNSNGNTNFIVNPVQPGNEVNVGPYQLEIRQASEYGITLSPPPGTPPYIVLNQTFDIHDRLTQSTTVVASPGYLLADAQTFSISNGVETVTFEFDDRTRNNGVASNHVQISFDPSDSAVVMAQRIRDAINLKGVQDLVHITAASADGVTSGASSTSDRVNLSGDVVTVAAGVFDTSPSSGAAVAESNKSNDTLATATATGIVAGGNGGFRSAGVIGDNPALQDLNKDVDLFRVDLAQGEIISVNIDAGILGSPLDSYLRVFDAFGQVVMVTDFLGNLVPLVSDDNQAPGEAFSLDSYLVLQAPTAGAYYLGVSGYNNSRYNPTLAGSGTAGSNGRYQLTIQRPLTNEAVTPVTYNYKGDANLFRDQGQTIISDNRISNSSGFGIVSAPGTRTTGEPHPGVPQNLSQINTSRLAPGVTITNNLLVGNGLGGIDFRGDAVAAGQQLGVVPFGRIINNTVVGDPTGATPRGVGIRVANNAAPTLMNNVLVGLATGVNVDQSSTSTATVLGRSTILGGTLYQNNIANSGGTGNIGTGTFPIIAAATEKLFVNPAVGNFYPAAAAPQIDSSVDSLDDRFAMVQLRSPMGISSSPILAPTRDLSGQVRVDDTNVPPLPGLGENVFKDRGALERGDFESPTAKLVTPEDNGPHDADSNANAVSLVQASLDQFSIQLSDGSPVQPGSGIDNATINGASLRLLRDGQTLVEGEAYSFAYDATSHIIRVIPLAGTWEVNRTYVIELFGQQRLVLGNVSGAALQDGASFDVTDQFSNTVTFEYDSGYVVQVPETLDVLIPLAGGGTNGVADGDTITVSQQGASTVTFELDNNKVVTSGNVPLTFVATNSQGEIADKLVDLLKKANLGLSPVNAGSGLVHLGVDGTQTLSVQSLNITSSGSPTGIKDGQKFTIDNGTKLVTFEFASHGATTGNVAVPFTLSQTNIQIAASLKAAISGAGLGLLPNDLGQGRVQVGGTSHHVMVVNQSVQSGQSIQSALILSGQPGARPAFGIRIPTTGGAISKLLVDGETFKISHGAVTATFEFDSGTSTTPGNIRIPFGPTTTPNQLADAMVSAIRNAGLGLLPSNATYGVVTLGGDATYSLDLTTSSLIPSSLTQLGQPGVPEATAIPFVPDAIFTAEQVAQRTVGYINSNTTLVGVQAVAQGGYVAISGAASVVSGGVQNVTGIKDLAGNPLAANRADGSTVFTVYIGDGLNYGQAPQLDPLVPGRYPTLRVDDGARHKVVSGFSLGPTESIMVDGSPRVDASGDGVAFDATTPLMPGRPFNLIVSPRGIGTVVATAFLDGWIDFNGDGVWDSDEQIIISRRVTTNGDLTINGLTPGDAIVGPTYARFRLSTTAGLLPTGLAAAGEVEDYLVTIERSPWQNPSNRFDVDGSKLVTPIDVLTEINYVNSHPDGSLPTVGTEGPPPYYDVDGNGRAEPADILAIISEINSPTKNVTSGGEGESAPVAQAATAGSVVSIGQESLVSAPAAMSVSGSTIDSSVATLNSASSNAAGTYGVAPAFVGPSKNLQSDLTLRSTSPKKPNHLNDILADDYDWSSIAEDVDKALQKEDARDAVFASLGV